MILNTFDPECHVIRDVEVTRYLRRELKVPDIITVYFPESDTWSICVWVYKGRGVFRELKAVKSIYALDRQAVADLRAWANRRTKTLKEHVKELRAASRELDRKHVEALQESREIKQAIGRRVKRKFGNIKGEDPIYNTQGGFWVPPEAGV